MSVESYPLRWPDGWPRSRVREDGERRFRTTRNSPSDAFGYKSSKPVTFDDARVRLGEELERMGAVNITLSTNVPLRLDGAPRASEANRKLPDPGAAIYFTFRGKAMVMACDRFEQVSANIRSLGLAIEAMRQLERHCGGTMMERAFTGFAAIAPPNWKKPWREVFGIKPDWTGDLTALFRQKAKERHPDSGGADTLMAELNIAYAEGKAELGL